MSWLSRLNIIKTKNNLTITLGLIVLLLIPAVLALIYIHTYAVNVPLLDQYKIVPLFDKFYSGHLSIFDFVAQHMEHRIFLPRLVMLGLGLITHYNVIAEEYLSWFFLLLTCLVILRAFVKAFGFNQNTLVKFIPVTWILFNINQSSTYLWGFQIAFPMTIFFGALSLYLLATSNRIGWRFGLALLCGIACNLSMSNGLLIWPIGIIQIFNYFRFFKKNTNRPRITMFAIWSLVGIIAFIMYFIGFVYPHISSSLSYIVHHPVSAIISFLACVGGPLAPEVYLASIAGVLFLIVFFWAIIIMVKKEPEPQPFTTFCVSLGVFGLASAVLIVLGRDNFGYEHMIDPHYITMTMLSIIGGYLLITSIRNGYQNIKLFLQGALLCLIIIGVVISVPRAIDAGNGEKDWWPLNAYYLSTYEIQSDKNLLTLYPDVKLIRDDAAILKKYNMSVFSEPALKPEMFTSIAGNTPGSIETINGITPSQENNYHIVIDSQNETTLTILGWAIDQQAQKTAGGVFINVDGQKDIPSFYGMYRPDIIARFGDIVYGHSGYSASFATSALKKGQHILSLKIITADKKGYYEPKGEITLEIK